MTESTCETLSFDLPAPGRVVDASQIQQADYTLIIQDKLQTINQLHAQGLIPQEEFLQRRTQILKEAAKLKNQRPQQQRGSMYGGQQPQQATMGGSFYGGGQQPQRATMGGQQPQQATMGGSFYGGQQPQQATMGGSSYDGQQPQQATMGGSSYGGQQPQQATMGGSFYGGQQPQQATMGGSSYGGQQPQRAVAGGPLSKDDPAVIQLDMLFESGFIDKAEYDQRMTQLNQSSSPMVGGQGTPQKIVVESLSPQHSVSPQRSSSPSFSHSPNYSPSPSPSPSRSSYLGVPSSPSSPVAPEGNDLNGVLPTKKRGPVSDNEQNRQLNMKREQEKKVRLARKRAVLQQIQAETEPNYNDSVAVAFPQEVADGANNCWLQLDPNNRTRPATDLQKISEMLSSGRPETVDLALRYLTHLSTTAEFLQILPQTTAMRGIVRALGGGRGGAQEGIVELACWVISNLATVEQNRPILRKAGAMRAVVPYLGVSNGQALQQVLSSCSNLLQEPLNKVAFEQLGGHNHLVSLLNRAVDGDLVEKQSQIVRVICILGFQDDDIKQVVLAGGGIRLFLKLLYSPEVEVQRFSCHALSSLAADGSQNDLIREEGGLAPLLHLLGSTDPFIREKISHLIANLTANDTNMDVIREQGSIPMLVELSQCDYEPVQLPIMWALSNLLLSVENQNIFEDLGGIDILVNQLSSTNGKLVGRVGWAMVNLTQFSDFVRKNIGERPGAMSTILRQLMGGPEEGRGPLLRALVNLLLTFECEDIFLQNRGIEVILALLRAKEPQAGQPAGRELLVQPQDKELCLMALVNISKSEESRNEIKNKEGLQAILQAIYRPSTGNMQYQALRLLTNIVMNGRIRYMLKTNQNVMQTLTSLCESQMVQIRRQAEMCKNNLSFPCTEFDETNYVQQSTPGALAAIEVAQKEMEDDLAEELEFAAQMLEDLDIDAELGNKPKLSQQDVVYLNQQDVEEMTQMQDMAQMQSEPVAQQIVIESVAMMASQAVIISQPQQDQPQTAVIEVLTAQQPQRAVISEAPKPQQAQTDAIAYQEMIKKQQEKQRKMNEMKEAALRKKMEEKEEKTKQEEAEAAAVEAVAQDARAQATLLEQQGLQQQAAAKNEEAREAEEKAKAKHEARRMNIAAELLVTEKTYVEGLRGMAKKYMQPMLSASTSKKPPISEEAVKSIFVNLETILTYHQMLLEGIEKRVNNWNPNSKIGDLFVDMIDRLVCYAQYVNNYDLAVKMLTDIEAKSPAFHEFLQQLTAEASKAKIQNLFSLLVLPVQRLPRYEMMFSDLIRHTPQGHEDLENLKTAHKKIMVVAKKIDEAKHSFDCDRHMKKVAKLLLGRPKSLIHENRILHEFGNLTVNRGTAFYCLLFSDILTITRIAEGNIEAYEWVKDVNLQGGQLKNYRDSDSIQNAFGLTTGGETYLFNTQDGETKNKWLSRFQKVLSASPQRLNDVDLSAVETKRIKRLQRRSQRGSKVKLLSAQ